MNRTNGYKMYSIAKRAIAQARAHFKAAESSVDPRPRWGGQFHWPRFMPTIDTAMVVAQELAAGADIYVFTTHCEEWLMYTNDITICSYTKPPTTTTENDIFILHDFEVATLVCDLCITLPHRHHLCLTALECHPNKSKRNNYMRRRIFDASTYGATISAVSFKWGVKNGIVKMPRAVIIQLDRAEMKQLATDHIINPDTTIFTHTYISSLVGAPIIAADMAKYNVYSEKFESHTQTNGAVVADIMLALQQHAADYTSTFTYFIPYFKDTPDDMFESVDMFMELGITNFKHVRVDRGHFIPTKLPTNYDPRNTKRAHKYKKLCAYNKANNIKSRRAYMNSARDNPDFVMNPMEELKYEWVSYHDFFNIPTYSYFKTGEEWCAACIRAGITTWVEYDALCQRDKRFPVMVRAYYRGFHTLKFNLA